MAGSTSRLGRVSGWLGRLALIATVLGPLLAHFEILAPFQGFALFGIGLLMAVACLILGLIALLLGPGPTRGATFGGMLPALALVLAVYVANGAGTSVPRINDITTDTANPPLFVAAATLPENSGRDLAYPGDSFATQQREGYPDLAPIQLAVSPDEAFKQVAAAARSMEGWSITREDATTHTLEGYDTSKLFRFKDDFVIQVRPGDNGTSVVQMRSKSRDGKGDMGANAARIQAFFARLRA
jgi:uncharacterized protein (DUF1499 family)